MILKTTVTPRIELRVDGQLFMSGVSVPENSLKFYEPVFEWLGEYKKAPASKIRFEMAIDYLNTASTRALVDIIYELKKLVSDVNQLELIWGYETGDEDMLEFGKELEILADVKIGFRAVSR